jgi:hypothetical protein
MMTTKSIVGQEWLLDFAGNTKNQISLFKTGWRGSKAAAPVEQAPGEKPEPAKNPREDLTKLCFVSR